MTCGVTAMVIVGTAGAVRLDASEVGCGGIGLLAVQAVIVMSSATAIAIVIAKMAMGAAAGSEFQ
jgi:hypothetical protein